ncbi:polysaccharide pyruvyl transferase family protein [Pyxidicoccus parkwayensis]|uniref:Polysaccharide pyruvyl transferase family protein n=1 Tax=Pyxidicoccus parkwayensis TaxID=2813578 RepID=A0ABX7P5K3_9BACT|nr:polysaccharide pyruvyl transferase family protein [Pyxidicoccus parkwaysis]QSQ25727.1 polysaccharide pyruvyl transferase family protein [Pyxidicoccus parkwaysis]
MRFGVLDYKTQNLGDEIQSLAAMRFLPRVDDYIERDSLGAFQPVNDEPIAMVLNGWFGHGAESWPPPEAIRPLLVSMHLASWEGGPAHVSAADFFLDEPVVQYLRENGPVGARDLHTLDLLQKRNVPAYFSGCMTLTLQRSSQAPRGDYIVVNDVPDEVLLQVRRLTHRRIIHTTHEDLTTPAGKARFDKARELLALYESAHCVITTRLHCMLPCLALGTPVLLIEAGQEPSRFPGLDTLVRRCSATDFVEGRAPFDVERPEPNSDEFRKLRSSLEQTVTSYIERMSTSPAPSRGTTPPMELRLQTLQRLCARRREQLERVSAELPKQADALASVTARLTARDAELAALASEREQLRQQLTTTSQEGERLRSDLAALTSERERLRQQLAAATQEGEGLRSALAAMTGERDGLLRQLHEWGGSYAWRMTVGLRTAAARVPGLRAGARQVMDALAKR